jgi:DNA repair protein RadC
MPREKLIHKGRESLTDLELLALLLGAGVKGKSALSIAETLLGLVEQDLNRLACQNHRELMRIKGVGEAKAMALIAALELGRRKQAPSVSQLAHISCSEDAYQNLSSVLTNLYQEEFWVLLLNRANKVLGKARISMGGMSGTLVDPKLVFKIALENKASALVLAHNHPSGNSKPSEADLKLTLKIKSAADLLDIQVLDHLIFTDSGYYSMADSGVL